MAKMVLVINVPGWSTDDLQKAVHDLDEIASGEGNGIEQGKVTAIDVLSFILSGQLGVVIDAEANVLGDE